MKKLSSGLLMAAVVVLLLGVVGCEDEPSSPSDRRDIISFVVNDKIGAIDAEKDRISVILPVDTDLTVLAPEITISSGASVTPKSGIVEDFSNPVTYTVTAESGASRQYIVTVTIEDTPVTLSFIQATAYPAKTVYEINEPLNPTGLVVMATYSNGSVKEVFDYTLDDVDTSTGGAKTVTVTLGDQEATFVILVKNPPAPVVLEEITITSHPKTVYELGDLFEPYGLVVKGIYSDGSYKEELNYTLSGFDSSTLGEKVITVTFETFTTTYKVLVKDTISTINRIAVTTAPTKLVYAEDEDLDLSDIIVTGYYTNGTSVILSHTSWSHSGFIKGEFGTQTIKVTYYLNNTLFDTFDIEVTPVARELTLTIGLLGSGYEATFFGFPKATTVAGQKALDRNVDFVLSWTGQPSGHLTIPTQIILGTSTSEYDTFAWVVDGSGEDDDDYGNYYDTDNNIITLKARDFTLERVHTISFTGTTVDGFLYSKTLEFIVVK